MVEERKRDVSSISSSWGPEKEGMSILSYLFLLSFFSIFSTFCFILCYLEVICEFLHTGSYFCLVMGL